MLPCRCSLETSARGLGRAYSYISDTIFATAGCSNGGENTAFSNHNGAVVTPLYLSTTFEREQSNLNLQNGYNYSRLSNPTRKQLETLFADIEGGKEAFAFSSGMEACKSFLLSCTPHTHIILPDDLYHGVFVLISKVFTRLGFTYQRVDMTCISDVRKSILTASTSSLNVIVWLETPSNPMCKVTDIPAISELAREMREQRQNGTVGYSITVVVDATWSTPYLIRPLTIGADIVIHSTTKYICGHSDVLGGVLVAGNNYCFAVSAELEQLRLVHTVGGGVMAPFDAYLTMRGLRTLPVRVRQHSDNAMAIAKFLHSHARVESVFYPGLPTHPQHVLSTELMGGSHYGGMLSFTVRSGSGSSASANEDTSRDAASALQVVRAVKIFRRATSLGGTESLIVYCVLIQSEHRATVEGEFRTSPLNLLRISVGLENVEDLIQDLDGALKASEA